ncbi:hypothetical protein [Streptomyces sp. NRRL B-24484]|uniref:hypothetical protein n=1 Tax=Streptomyces sp. NRRL B-24484 TaxID=1463833 RepID=UPI0004C08A05|nr:hypothetical protein [Streptomyces sp. NRRL B-24484]
MSVRCSHCFLPVEADGDQAAAHDAPYAVEAYGQCRGSGQATVSGHAVPPVVWGVEPGRTFVELGVLPSPLPEVTREGWTVSITGARFTHAAWCMWCRRAVETFREGGTIRIGFDRRGRSFEEYRAGPLPKFDGVPCPNAGCENRRVGSGMWSRSGSPALPVADVQNVQGREWERLRRRLGVWSVDMSPADVARLAAAAR